MSLLKTNSIQLGQSSTATQNFTVTVPAVQDGTLKLARGNAGATTQDIVNIDTAGNVGIGKVPSVGTSAGNLDVAGTVTMSSSFSHRNKIINGDFDFWQRATSQTVSGMASCDRWYSTNVGTTKVTSQQSFALGQTDVPNNPTYFCRTVVTSVAGAANYSLLYQPIESVRTLAGTQVTLSFWAKADAAKNIAVELLQYFGAGGTPSALVSGIGTTLIPLTTTWTKFVVNMTVPSIAGTTLGTNSGDYLALYFWFDAGSTYSTRTNNLGQQSGTFDIAQVQLEEGNVATPFEHRPIAVELALCQRYCVLVQRMWGNEYTTTASTFSTSLPVTMRTSPTSGIAVTAVQIIGIGPASSLSGLTNQVLTPQYVRYTISHAAASSAGQPVEATTTGYLSAEL